MPQSPGNALLRRRRLGVRPLTRTVGRREPAFALESGVGGRISIYI